MSLTEKLIVLREKKGLTQEEAAERLEVSRQAVSRWELGAATPTVGKLKSLSRLYGVPLSTLLDDDEELPRQEESGEANEAGKQIEKQPARKRTMQFAALILLLLVAISVLVFIGVNKSTEMPTQIENMESDTDWENTEADKFSVDW